MVLNTPAEEVHGDQRAGVAVVVLHGGISHPQSPLACVVLPPRRLLPRHPLLPRRPHLRHLLRVCQG